MKKLTLLFLILAVLMISGCNENKKDGYPPEAENDKIYTTIGGKKNAYQHLRSRLILTVMKRTMMTVIWKKNGSIRKKRMFKLQ